MCTDGGHYRLHYFYSLHHSTFLIFYSMRTNLAFNRLLTGFILLIIVMISLRIIFYQNIRYLSIIWNLFLAWIPFAISFNFKQLPVKNKVQQLLVFFCWLIFFPNALYIITDLIHLNEDTSVPIWFDAAFLFSSAFVGLLMAFVSLARAENYLLHYFNCNMVRVVLIPILLFVSSFGVYLGRFERWNSWDVITNPFALSADILHFVGKPVTNYKVWAITLLFSLLYGFFYFSLKILPLLFSEMKIHDKPTPKKDNKV